MIYHVSVFGNDGADGTEKNPFKTINRAAAVAVAGDTVRVHEGVYREWVNPASSGEENNRITYEAAEGERAVIKGSEIITDWERESGTVWRKTIPNSFFGDFNPYREQMFGDWLVIYDFPIHLGDVYINGVSMYEAASVEDLYAAPIRTRWRQSYEEGPDELIPNPELTKYRWLAEAGEENTVIRCNFHELNPNEECIEINVRKCCFYPTKTGISYITLRGFEIAHAACPFVPPTADQVAMVGANWSRGWIIENNLMHDAKCSAISIGKEGSTGDNEFYRHRKKYSHFYQTEAVFTALREAGWRKENIGSHVIRNNEIYDCGQNAIVGHMGCAFSRIEHNHIHHIATKHEFYGHEIAGIKLHASIDVIIENNCIHNCTLGTWLDWEAQGTRVTKNLYYDNNEDFFIEVTHGPCLVDNNVMLSENTLRNLAQGTAFVHNLILGGMMHAEVPARHMPYHFPHSTDVRGVAPIYGGDDRFVNNILLGVAPVDERFCPLTALYDDYTTLSEYTEKMNDRSKTMLLALLPKQPFIASENCYCGVAKPFYAEEGAIRAECGFGGVETDGKTWVLTLQVSEKLAASTVASVTTDSLGRPIYTEQRYETPSGEDVDFSADCIGGVRSEVCVCGPFASLLVGENKITVFKK